MTNKCLDSRYVYPILFFILGFFAYQYHCQHKILTDKIKSYDVNLKMHQEKIDEVIDHHNKMYNICDSLINVMDSLPLGSPLDTLHVSSNYGSRKHPITKKWSHHPGIDFYADWRDTVYATGHGIVGLSGYNHGYGRTIIIDHVSGYKSKYAHLTRYFVKKGEQIKKGDPIGTAGNTGETNGYHLHYEVLRNGITANPQEYIKPL